MDHADFEKIKQLIEDSLRDQEKRLERKFDRRFERMNIEIDERFKQERKWNNKKFEEVLVAIKKLEAGMYGFDGRVNNHEVRIQNLEKISST